MGRKTNKQRRATQSQSAREKAAAARAVQQRADQRRRAIVTISSVVVLAVVGALIAVIAINHKPSSSAGDATSVGAAAVLAKATSVSDNTLNSVGGSTGVVIPPSPVSGQPPLTSNGKPELLYIGAEFCPYCAVERWSLAEALSKFGKLHNVNLVHSAVDDGNYASLDFKGTTYNSKYLTFTPVENEDRESKQLQPVTSAQKSLWTTLDKGSPGFPFVDFGNKLAYTVHPPLDPSALGTASQAQIAAQLNDPTSQIAKTVGSGANQDIAAICTMTNNQPASVCSRPLIKTLQTQQAAATSG